MLEAVIHGTISAVNAPVEIRPATADEVIDLRHAVLRAGLPRETAIFNGDKDSAALHFVAVHGGSTVACVTLHPSTFDGEQAWQLRGMAVAPEMQRQGVGAKLLEAVYAAVASDSVRRVLWCNARLPATRFYQRHGWRVVSDRFEIPSAGPHVRMIRPF